MDEKILEALSDIGSAIEKLTQSLKSKDKAKSDSAKLLQSADLGKKLDLLGKEVRSIKKDTQQIIKNQETLLKISRDKSSKTDVFEKSGEKKSKIKDGVNTVIMIAAGVLAIGLAFKLIGEVDFLSVIALSIALPLVAIAFEKIAKLKDLNKADMKNLFLVTVTMALSLTAASWIMTAMATITPGQGLTAIMIAGTFAAISFTFSHLVKGLAQVKLKDLMNMPIILAAVSFSIVVSSRIMQRIVPIRFDQGLTAILIAGTFAVVSYGLSQIVKSIKNIEYKDVLKMPAILAATSLAIMLSSIIMQGIIPININQGLTAILIAATFTVVSYGLSKIVKSIKNIEYKDVLKMPAILAATSLAIMASSIIMQGIIPISPYQALTAIVIAGVFAIMSLTLPSLVTAVKLMSIKDALMMTAVLPLLATAITVSSYILQGVQVIPFDTLVNVAEQAITMGISALAIGGAAWLLSKMGIESLVEGGLAVVILAGVIMASSQLLSMGDYTKYPSLDWSKGVGLSFVVFGAAAAVLGAITLSGIGAGILVAGAAAMIGLSYAISKTGNILNDGVYGKYPSLDWAEGVAKSLSAFGKIASNVGIGGILLNAIGSLIGSGPEDLAKKMVSVDKEFSKGDFTKYPSLDWAKSITLLMSEFSAMSSITLSNDISKIEDISKQIVRVSNILGQADYSNPVPVGYLQNLSENIKSYVGLLQYLDTSNVDVFTGLTKTASLASGLIMLANAYNILGNSIMRLNSSINALDVQKIGALSTLNGTVVLMSLMDSYQFEKMMDALEDKAGIFVKIIDKISNAEAEGAKSFFEAIKGADITATQNSPSSQIIGLLSTIANNTSSLVTINTTLNSFLTEYRSKKKPDVKQ